MFKGSRKRGRVGRECWRLYSTTTPPSAKMKDGCGLKFLPIPVSQKYSYYTNQRMDHSCLLVILLLPVTQAWPGNLSHSHVLSQRNFSFSLPYHWRGDRGHGTDRLPSCLPTRGAHAAAAPTADRRHAAAGAPWKAPSTHFLGLALIS